VGSLFNFRSFLALSQFHRRGSPSSCKSFVGKCNHCKKEGHKEAQCWIKHPELRPAKRRDDGSEGPKYAMIGTVIKRQSNPQIWFADSGASDHFSPHRDLFETFNKLDEPVSIVTAEGTATGTDMGMITVTVLGQDDIETKLQLHDVIYAPSMSSNLFSLNEAYDRGYETRMTPGYGIRIFHKDTLVANTVRVGGLCRLKIPADAGDAFAYAAAQAANEATRELDVSIWHRRMGHLREDNIKKLANMVDGMKIKVGTAVGVCEACMQGKQTRQPSHKPAIRAKEPLELIHSDLCGPITPTTFGGVKYYILFIDDYTRMTRIYPLKGKTSANVLEQFKEYKAEVEKQTGKQIKRLRMDGGGEYEKWVEAYLKQVGIVHETTAPYSPEQNGVTEQANQTIMERVKATIAEYELDKRLWMELASTIVYLKNRSPISAVPMSTPYEAWHGTKLNLSHLKIIGLTAYVHVPKEKRVKLDVHSHKGIMIGYGGTNQYRIWDLIRKDIVVSRDVVFTEGKSIEGTPAVYIEETKIRDNSTVSLVSLINNDSITVSPEPRRARQTHAPVPTELEPASDLEDESVDPQILLQEPAEQDTEGRTQRASG